jgi:hypothetical protein
LAKELNLDLEQDEILRLKKQFFGFTTMASQDFLRCLEILLQLRSGGK